MQKNYSKRNFERVHSYDWMSFLEKIKIIFLKLFQYFDFKPKKIRFLKIFLWRFLKMNLVID